MLYCIPTKKKEKNTLHGVAVAGVQVAIAGIQAVAGILARTVGQPGQVAAGIRPIKRRLNGGGGVGGIGSQWLNSGGIGPIGSQWLNSSSRIEIDLKSCIRFGEALCLLYTRVISSVAEPIRF